MSNQNNGTHMSAPYPAVELWSPQTRQLVLINANHRNYNLRCVAAYVHRVRHAIEHANVGKDTNCHNENWKRKWNELAS